MPLTRNAASIGPMQPAALKVRRNDPYAFDVLSSSRCAPLGPVSPVPPTPMSWSQMQQPPSPPPCAAVASCDVDAMSTSSRSSGNGYAYYGAASIQTSLACGSEAPDSTTESIHEGASMVYPYTPAVNEASLYAAAPPSAPSPYTPEATHSTVPPTPANRGAASPRVALSSSTAKAAPAATPRARKVTVAFKFGQRDFRSTFRVNIGDQVVVEWDKESTHIGTIAAIAADDGVVSPTVSLPELALMRRARDRDSREAEHAKMREPTTVIECQRIIDKLISSRAVRTSCTVHDAEWLLDRSSVTVLLRFPAPEHELDAVHEALVERLQASVFLLQQ